jgi:hypothetical protein
LRYRLGGKKAKADFLFSPRPGNRHDKNLFGRDILRLPSRWHRRYLASILLGESG